MTDLEIKVEALMRCVPEDALVKALAEVVKEDRKPITNDNDLRREIRKVLTEIGVPAHNLGYRYLAHALELVVKDENILSTITKGLYPAVAAEFETTPSRAERSIRRSIEMAWNRGDVDVLNKYFGNTVSPNKGHTTNAEFLAQTALVLRERMVV